MMVIFALSAQPDLSSGLRDIDFVGRKLAHMTEHGLLWWLSLRALATVPDPRARGAPGRGGLSYAATDEWHQAFVIGRHGSPVDWRSIRRTSGSRSSSCGTYGAGSGRRGAKAA